MSTWYGKIYGWWVHSWRDAMVYGFTVICVFLGDYVLHGTRPEIGIFPFVAAMVVSVIICGVVDLMKGRADTPEKIAGKKRNFTLRIVVSGLAGMGSSALIPVLMKQVFSSIGIQL